MLKSFASDNTAGVHPRILAAMASANEGHAKAYGMDPWTSEAADVFRGHFGDDIDLYFVFLGTAANVLGLNPSRAPGIRWSAPMWPISMSMNAARRSR